MDARQSLWSRVTPAADRFVHRLKSAALRDTLEITVVPPQQPPGRKPAPVLYVLDSVLTLETVVGWSRVYGRYSENAVPPCFVVSIGYPTDEDGEYLALRIRDYTPTARTGSQWTPPKGAGQGPLLLEAIASEIMPFVEATYGASRTDRTIVGWSLGGLFALSALFHRPKLFRRHLVVGPSLWWDERVAFRTEADFAARHEDLAARLFMAVGSKEQSPGQGWLNEGFPDEVIARFRQVSNFRAFTRRLRGRAYPRLRMDSVVFPDEHHMTVYPAAVARGLVKLFET
ncbi:alpha/beta hydrolase-fold protein [soil metagenome]